MFDALSIGCGLVAAVLLWMNQEDLLSTTHHPLLLRFFADDVNMDNVFE